MKRYRYTLLGALGVLSLFQYLASLIPSEPKSVLWQTVIVLQVFAGIWMFSTLSAFISSFFSVVEVNGRPRLTERNFVVRFTRRFFDASWSKETSPCKIVAFTSLTYIMSSFVLLLSCVLGFVIYTVISGQAHLHWDNKIGYLGAGGVLFISLFWLSFHLQDSENRYAKIFSNGFPVVTLSALCGFIIWCIHNKYSTSIPLSSLIFVAYIIGSIVAVAILVRILFAFSRVWAKFIESTPGQKLFGFYKAICPTVAPPFEIEHSDSLV